MIPNGPVRNQISSELATLGGTEEQIKFVGDTLFTVAALPGGHDTEYVLDRLRQAPDDLCRRGVKIIIDGLVAPT